MATTINTTMNNAFAPNIVIAEEDPHPASKHRNVFRSLGILQLVIGGIGFILGIVLYILLTIYYHGTGIWGGVFYFLSGGFSVSIGVRANRCNVIAGLVMSVLASIIGFICGLLDALMAFVWNGLISQELIIAVDKFAVGTHVFTGLHVVMSLFGIVQMILAITVAAYCCKGTCGHRNVQGQVWMTTSSMVSSVQQQQYNHVPVGAQIYTNVAAGPINPPAYEIPDKKN